MAGCREREAELLDFTQKLTEKNVRLQLEFSTTEAKVAYIVFRLFVLYPRWMSVLQRDMLPFSSYQTT
jgi:hypothetical protein